jgi:hypothetical protein
LRVRSVIFLITAVAPILFLIIFNAVQPQSVLSFIFRVGWYVCIVNSFSGLSFCLISCTYLVNFEKKGMSCTSLANGQTPCFLYLSRKGRDIRFPVLVSDKARRLDCCFSGLSSCLKEDTMPQI